jgi:ribonuclease HI
MMIFTDGACGKDGTGGWAFVVEAKAGFHADWGKEPNTTNQQMELLAAVMGLKYSVQTSQRQVQIISDSAYLVNCFNDDWLKGWLRRGWKTSNGQPVKNRELWEALHRLAGLVNVTWTHVKGHNGHEMNELADRLAVEARTGVR